jgi:NCS1 family nucleobase:cation symporter-1
MASNDDKAFGEKNGSPASSAIEHNETGQVGKVSFLKRRLPGFSLEVRQEESSFAATPRASNADFDPIPPSKRTWNWGAYVAYWMADAWAVSNWEVGEFPRDVLLLWSQMLNFWLCSFFHDFCRP